MGKVTIDTLVERNERLLKDGLRPIKICHTKKDDEVSELIKESEYVIDHLKE